MTLSGCRRTTTKCLFIERFCFRLRALLSSFSLFTGDAAPCPKATDAESSTGPPSQRSAMASSSVNQRAWPRTSEANGDSHCIMAVDVEPSAALSDHRPPLASSSRKRSTCSSTSEDTELYSATGDDSSDDDFETVRSRKAKRRSIKSSSPAGTLTSQSKGECWPHTILFMPEDSTISLRAVNRQALSMYFEGVAPNDIKDIRVNTRKNILAVDTMTASAIDKLRRVSDLGGIKVRPVIPMDGACTAGVIYDIDLAIANSDLPTLIKPANEGVLIANVLRLGNTRCVKIMFKGDSIPSHVKVGHFRHPVRPFVPKPLQCHNCMKIGHIKSVCTNTTVCPRCAEPHTADACRATSLKCRNCDGPHDAASKECPRIKKEIAIIKQMVRDNSTHREAAERVRRRRSRRRRRVGQSVAHNPFPPSTSEVVSTKRNEVEKLTAADEWPTLPRTQPAKEPPARPRRPTPSTESTSVEDVSRVDRQIIPMLRSLVAVMADILRSLGTPTARSGLQVLDALSPVLASLA